MSENKYTKITSLQNEIIKNAAKLHLKKYRVEEGLIILEGEKSVFGAVDAGIKLQKVFVTDEKTADRIRKNIDTDIYLINEKVAEKISSTKSPSNIIAVANEPKYGIDEILKKDKIVLLDSIKDTGNLGTIIRSAAALGIEGILLFGECADEFSSKVIRSSAGNIFKMPIARIGLNTEAVQNLKKSHKIISTVAPQSQFGACAVDCTKINYREPFVVMLGCEASGLCNDLLKHADLHSTLNMDNKVESLNLAVFAGIIFYIINSKNN